MTERISNYSRDTAPRPPHEGGRPTRVLATQVANRCYLPTGRALQFDRSMSSTVFLGDPTRPASEDSQLADRRAAERTGRLSNLSTRTSTMRVHERSTESGYTRSPIGLVDRGRLRHVPRDSSQHLDRVRGTRTSPSARANLRTRSSLATGNHQGLEQVPAQEVLNSLVLGPFLLLNTALELYGSYTALELYSETFVSHPQKEKRQPPV